MIWCALIGLVWLVSGYARAALPIGAAPRLRCQRIGCRSSFLANDVRAAAAAMAVHEVAAHTDAPIVEGIRLPPRDLDIVQPASRRVVEITAANGLRLRIVRGGRR